MTKITALHFDITGDCSSAVQALSNTESAIDRVAGKNAVFGIQASGASNAIRDLDSVSTARDRITAGGPSMLSVGVAGADSARADLRALGSDVQSASRAFSSMSSMSVGLAGASSVSQLVSDLGQGAGDVARSMEMVGAGVGNIDRTATSLESNLAPALASAGSRTQALHSEMRALGNGVSDAGGELERFTQKADETLGSYGRLKVLNSTDTRSLGVPGTPDGPPLDPPGGDDGGGRGPRGPGGGGGRGGRGAGPDPFGNVQEGIGLAGAGGMGALVGGLVTLGAGAVGLLAVDEAIKKTPDLAYAANGAMLQLDKGIRQAAQGAIAEGVPALRQLGGVMHELGDSIGSVGAAHMQTALGGVAELAGGATTALQRLDPAIDPAIHGLVGLGDAVMQGLTSPTAVAGMKAAGDALANPTNVRGIASAIDGATSIATTLTKVSADVLGSINSAFPGADTGVANAGLTGTAFGGMLGLSKGPKGVMAGGYLAGLGSLASAYEETHGQEGAVTPGIVGEGIGALLGSFGGPLGAALGGTIGLAGGTAVHYANEGARTSASKGATGDIKDSGFWAATGHTLEKMLVGPTGTLGGINTKPGGMGFGSGDGGESGAQSTPGTFSTGTSITPKEAQSADKHGWTTDDKGNLVPGSAYSDHVQRHLEAQNAGRAALDQHAAPPSSTPALTQSSAPSSSQLWHQIQQNRGFGSGVMPMPSSFQQQMNQMPQAAQHAMDQTQSMVNTHGTQIGNQLPASMSQGIQSNTGQACNAAADLSKSATKCAQDTIGMASPAKAFIAIGESTGPGFAIGARNSAGQAAAATGAMMLNVTDVAANYAADGGKQLGVIYGTNIVSGINTALDTKNLQGAGLAQGANSPIAQLALAALGLGGVAGNGASSWDLRNAGLVNFGSGTPAQQPIEITLTNNMSIDGTPMKITAQNVTQEALEGLLVRLGVQAR